MTRGQRLALLLGSIAALLVIGRGVVVLYVDHAWYSTLDASAVWGSKVSNTLLLYGGALFVGAVFAFANLIAVRRSIVSLTIPSRIGNIEIGEEVPPSRLVYVTGAMSLCASAVSLLALPPWTTLALWRSRVSFGEIDPYFGLDLSYFVTWLPFEMALYDWAVVLYTVVALLVVTIYALTPSLRWTKRRLLIGTYARRHIGILAGIVVAFIAWNIRLDSYRTLISGSGPAGAITYFDHQWILPTNVVVSLVVLGAAIVLMMAIWLGQTQTAFIVVSALLLTLFILKGVFPWIASQEAEDPANQKLQAAYTETQRLYTARAFRQEPIPPAIRYAADSAILADASQLQIPGGLMNLIYPGARGVTIERDSANLIKAPRVGGLISRFMIAWAEQNPRLLRVDGDPHDALVRHRDVRERVRAVAPIFTQSQKIGVRPAPLGVMWIVDLYVTSNTYPLSVIRFIGTTGLTYRRYVGTAYVNGATGGVTIIPDSAPGPVARAWFRTHQGGYLASALPPNFRQGLWPVPPADSSRDTAVVTDSAFRARITNLYLWMRSTLNAGDLRGFGEAFDSLGAAVGVPR